MLPEDFKGREEMIECILNDIGRILAEVVEGEHSERCALVRFGFGKPSNNSRLTMPPLIVPKSAHPSLPPTLRKAPLGNKYTSVTSSSVASLPSISRTPVQHSWPSLSVLRNQLIHRIVFGPEIAGFPETPTESK
jgi:hypothetical protein